MANLKIDIDRAVAAATNIKNYNRQIDNAFPAVTAAISRLDSTWDGSAAANAISKFNEIRSIFPEARYNVVDNFANFLMQQVGEGYAQTETVNKSLADAFK